MNVTVSVYVCMCVCVCVCVGGHSSPAHLVEAEVVLDGGGGVEDVALCRDRHDEAGQGLQDTETRNSSDV